MRTLKQLQELMQGEDQDAARAAAIELANFYFIYNEEYNALQAKLTEASARYTKVTQESVGVDHAEAMELNSLILSIQARMAVLDLKMDAFHNAAMSITPPTAQNVTTVKALSAQLAVLNAKDTAISLVSASLAAMADVVNQSF